MRILIVGAAGTEGSIEIAAALASEHDRIIAADAGAGLCASAGVVPDLVVGDFDSLGEGTAALMETGVATRQYPADKELSDLDLALQAARNLKASDLTITAAFTRRLDHTLASLGTLLDAADMAPRFVEPLMRGWLLTPQGRTSLRLSEKGGTVSLFALTSDSVVSCEGMHWPLQQAALKPFSARGLSNIIAEDEARIEAHSGAILVVMPEL